YRQERNGRAHSCDDQISSRRQNHHRETRAHDCGRARQAARIAPASMAPSGVDERQCGWYAAYPTYNPAPAVRHAERAQRFRLSNAARYTLTRLRRRPRSQKITACAGPGAGLPGYCAAARAPEGRGARAAGPVRAARFPTPDSNLSTAWLELTRLPLPPATTPGKRPARSPEGWLSGRPPHPAPTREFSRVVVALSC